MNRIIIACILTLCASVGLAQRNVVYVLDCTKSMTGYNGAPNIWKQTKESLKTELEKEARENPDARVTVLPFQGKVLGAKRIDLHRLDWPALEREIDGYTKRITETNICDAWRAAETCIDESCENYIVLMTDGTDNVGGSANTPARMQKLAEMLRAFCGKYSNTKGFYIQLSSAATLPQCVVDAINSCQDLFIIDGKEGIPTFGGPMDNYIEVNTRDLPADIAVGFSNPGVFAAEIEGASELMEVSIVGDKIAGGKVTLHIESKFGNDLAMLNELAKDSEPALYTVSSPEVNITNPDLYIQLIALDIRSIDFAETPAAKVERAKPFLWAKGNEADTLTWTLAPQLSEQAVKEGSRVTYKIKSVSDLSGCELLVDGVAVADSIITLGGGSEGVIQLIVPQGAPDQEYNLTLNYVKSSRLDRINGERPKDAAVTLTGATDTSMSLLELLCYILGTAIVLGLLLWFCLLKKATYPPIKVGTVTLTGPAGYYLTKKIKGARKVVLTSRRRKQGALGKAFTGEIIYISGDHFTPEVTIEAATTKKKVKVKGQDWQAFPSSTFAAYDKGTLTNLTTNAKTEIEFN